MITSSAWEELLWPGVLFSMRSEVMKLSPDFFTGGVHSIYFFAFLVLNAIAFAYIPRLHESSTAGTPASVFYEGLKRLARFWQR